MPEGYKHGKPDVGYWLKEIRHGIEFRKEYADEARWPIWRQYYRGNWAPGTLPSNMFFKMVRTLVPRIYFRNPSVSVTPKTSGIENMVFAKLLQRTDNKMINSMGMKKHMKRQVQDAWMFGTGVGKKGFGSQYHATPERFGQTTQPDSANLNAKLRNYVEYNYDIQDNMPWYRNNGPGNFILPAGCHYPEDARWKAFKITRTVGDVRTDPRLKNAKNIGSTHIENVSTMSRNRVKYDQDLVDLYEIRDSKTGMVFIICPSETEKVLLFEQDEFASLKIDAESLLIFNDDDESAWGVPDAKILEPLQLELNEIRTYTMYHRRLSIARILAKKGSITEEEAMKLISPNVLPIININGNPMMDVREFSPQMPDGLLQSDAMVRQDIRETQGFSRNSMGEYEQGSRKPSASEVQEVAQALGIRIDERRDMVADLLTDVVNDFHPIIFNHWDREQVEEITGPAGIPFWIKFRPSMMKKQAFNIKVDPDTAIPQTKDLREAKAIKTYEILKTNPLLDPYKLTSNLLHELHGVQFDDLMRGLPPQAGMTQDRPMEPGQFGQMLQNAASQNLPIDGSG